MNICFVEMGFLAKIVILMRRCGWLGKSYSSFMVRALNYSHYQRYTSPFINPSSFSKWDIITRLLDFHNLTVEISKVHILILRPIKGCGSWFLHWMHYGFGWTKTYEFELDLESEKKCLIYWYCSQCWITKWSWIWFSLVIFIIHILFIIVLPYNGEVFFYVMRKIKELGQV